MKVNIIINVNYMMKIKNDISEKNRFQEKYEKFLKRQETTKKKAKYPLYSLMKQSLFWEHAKLGEAPTSTPQ